MSTAEISEPAPPLSADPGAGRPPRRGVVVVYEGRAEGRAALAHAHALAAESGVPLTVAAVVHRERTDVGCGSCRQGAAFRNEMACECATEDLTEARAAISAAPSGVAVDYVLARGSFARMVPALAEERGADLIVLPARRPGRLRRLLTRDRAELLRRRTTASVLAAPAPTVSP